MLPRQRQGPGPCLCFLAVILAAGSARGRSVWTELPAPTLQRLNAVSFLNRTEGWAVGDAGTVVRFQKGAWQNFPSGTDEGLLSVAVLGTGEAWAVGENGTIAHFDGSVWAEHPQSGKLTVLPLHTVRFLSPSIGWAVGGSYCGSCFGPSGIALRYNGAAWVSATATIDPLYGVEVLADDSVWFCGGTTLPAGPRRLMHFDGTGFTSYACTPADGLSWRAVEFPFRSTGWVVGDGGVVWRYSSGTGCFAPDAAASSLTTATLRSLAMLSGSAIGVAVGDGGVRLKFSGSVWELDALGGADLKGVDVMNELEGQAVGGIGAARIAAFRAITEEKDLIRLRIYPNPVDPGQNEVLKIDRLPSDVDQLDVYTLRGELVASLGAGVSYDRVTGIAVWPARIRGGRAAATGDYILRIHTLSGKSGRGVILVVKK